MLPLLSCALPLPAEWYGNSSHIHALLLTISIGTVLLRCLRTKAGMQGILEGVRWYPSVGLLLIFLTQGLPVASGRWSSEVFGHAWQGMFDNPAGLACFACCLLAIESENQARSKWGLLGHWTVVGMLTAIVLLTHSRTGVLGVLLIAAIRLWQYRRLRWAVGLATALCLVGLFQVKRDSTSGRRFILQNTWQLIHERPLTGWGWHGFERYYMPVQADYFKQHTEDTAHAWLADDVRHPMNEFLLWWVKFGVIGPVALGALLLWPAAVKSKEKRVESKEKRVESKEKRVESIDGVSIDNKPISAPYALLSTLFLFACLSYPLHYAFTWLFIGLAWLQVYKRREYKVEGKEKRVENIDGASIDNKPISTLCSILSTLLIAYGTVSLLLSARLMQAEGAAERHAHHRALRIYRQLAPVCQWNPYFLYSYAHELYVTGQFEKALAYAGRCGQYWSRYDLTLLEGDIHRQLQQYTEAKADYLFASHMCPNRFAPLEGLLSINETQGDSAAVMRTAQAIMQKPVKIQSPAVTEIKTRAQQHVYRN